MTIQDGALSVRWADEASIMYERATGGLLKNNLLMHFAHADFEEVVIYKNYDAQILCGQYILLGKHFRYSVHVPCTLHYGTVRCV